MGKQATQSERMRQETQAHRREAADPTRPASAGAQEVLLALQQRAGNGAVGRLLDAFAGKAPEEPGEPLGDATRLDMESRFGQDFGDVRVHRGGGAAATARDARAEAYTTGEHIVFAPGRFDPASAGGRGLLAHELAHVVQQRRGGPAPALDAGASHEHGAHAAAAAYAGGSGPVGVSGATGVGMARSADDWLRGSVDLTNWGYSELAAEHEELKQWLDRQIAGDENTRRIEEAMAEIEARKRHLEQGVRGPQKPGRKGKRGKNAEDTAAAEPDPEMEPPRCLVEQATVVFQDRDEMRHEFDHIVAWLQRKSVSPSERRLLQDELQYLAPLLGETLQQQAQEKRRARIGAALTPSGGGAGRAAIVEAIRLVESIKPVSGHEDQYYLMHGEEMLTLTKDEVTRIRANAVAAMVGAIKQVEAIDDASAGKLEGQRRVDLDNGFAGWGVSLFTDTDTSGAIDKFMPISAATTNATSAFHGAMRRGDLMEMAMQLANAEEMALLGRELVNGHIDDIQATGAKVVTGLEITSAAAFTIVMVATAGAAAPVVGAGVTGLGATGATATLLTATGTAGIVGTEGFLLGGSSSTAGQLLAGNSLSDSLHTGLHEGLKTGETGVKIGLGTVLAPVAAARFGATAEGIGLGSQMLRTGAAVGTTNLAVDEASSLAFHQKSLSLGEAGTSFGGGFLGGVGGPVIGKLESPALRNLANMGWGATTSGGLNYLEYGDKDKALQAAALGGASSLSLGHSEPNQKTLDSAFNTGRSLRGSANSFGRSASRTLGATMLGVKLSGAAPDISGGGIDSHLLTPPGIGLHEPAAPSNRTSGPTKENAAWPDAPAVDEAPAAKAAAQEETVAPTKAAADQEAVAPAASTQGTASAAKPPKATKAPKAPKAAKPAKAPKAPKAPKATKSSATPRASRPKKTDVAKQSIDERIAQTEQALHASRKKTTEYFEEREKAGRSRKGGPKKGIDNAKELLWLLKRQKAYPDRQLLQGCEVRGVRGADGKFTSTTDIAGTGREPDFVELDGTNATMGELKSEWELDNSLKGGPGTDEGGQTTVNSKSKVGGQFEAEDKVIAHARKVNGKVVISGFDVRTGQRVEFSIDPDQMGRALYSSTAGFGIGSEYSN